MKHPEQRPPPKQTNTQKQEAIALIAAFVTDAMSLKRKEWILNSGASHHMCYDRELFDNYVINSSSKKPIETAGSMMRAKEMGSIRLTFVRSNGVQQEVMLEQVYHLANLNVNLLSANRIRKRGYYIDRLTQTTRNKTSREELCAYVTTNSHMIILTAEPTLQAYTANTKSDNPLPMELWHRRLGHLGLENLIRTANNTIGMTIPVGAQRKDPPLLQMGGLHFKPPRTIKC